MTTIRLSAFPADSAKWHWWRAKSAAHAEV
jgi:hypothetical protein